MYTMTNNNIVREHKRNIIILSGVLCIIGNDISIIKHHMIKLNKYMPNIPYKLFINLYIIKRYKLKPIQLQVLYNNLLFNSYIK